MSTPQPIREVAVGTRHAWLHPGPADDTAHVLTTIETVAAQLLQPTN